MKGPAFFTAVIVLFSTFEDWRGVVPKLIVFAVNTSDSAIYPIHGTGRTSIVAPIIDRAEENREEVALLGFLVETSSGRQVVLLQDHTLTDAAQVTEAWLTRGKEASVFTYSSSSGWLKRVLNSLNHAEDITNVVVACSTEAIFHIFREIRENSLESSYLRWFVVMIEDSAARVLHLLREGTQVALAVRQDRSRYMLYSTYVAQDNTFALRKSGIWKWKPESGGEGFLSHPLHLPLYSDFGGRNLKSAVVSNWPFFGASHNADGVLQPDSGIDTSILRALGHKLNFTFSLLEAVDGEWGGIMDNGTVTGMVGLVARHEANIAICEITITGIRESVIDFTPPYFLEVMTLVTQAPAERNRAFAVLSPFTYQVWLLLVAATVVMGPVLFGLSRVRAGLLRVEALHSLTSFSSNVFRALIYQNTSFLPEDSTLRIVIFSWFFFGLSIYALYAGTLTAELARPAFEEPIDSLTDALEAITTRGYSLIVVKGTTNEYILKEADGGVYKSLWEEFDPTSGYVDHYTIGIAKVLTGRYVYLDALMGSWLQVVKQGRLKYHMSKENFNAQGYGIVCTSGSPFKQVFADLLGYIAAAGLVHKWVEDEKAKLPRYVDSFKESSGVITLTHLQAAFFFLILGYIMACVTFVLEMVQHGINIL